MVDKLRAIALDSKLAGHFDQAEAEAKQAPAEAGFQPGSVDVEAIRKVALQLWQGSSAAVGAAPPRSQGEDPDRDGSAEPDKNG